MKLNKFSTIILLLIAVLFIMLFSRSAAAENIFTSEILAEFDGQNDEDAYIAARGRVYDVTALFSDGTHMGMEAGQDLTQELEEGPGFNILEGLEQVGYYVEVALTPDLLARFDGVERQEAYVAVDNLVYDVTDVFSGGTHQGNEAGQDLTDVFHEESPHDMDTLSDYYIVGLLVEETFTRAELSDYDAQDDSPNYAAVDGLVYDMAGFWPEGEHYGHQAGEYLTQEIFESPHGITVMLNVAIAGALDDFLLAVEENDVEEETDILYVVLMGIGVLAAISGVLLGLHAFRSVLQEV